ncbi:MAG TPA: PEP-CTERM sorting domain-containing protein [Phycisphaerae bacterium]|nr:PEP-CTERM sorting domain-containing protein [Phycisphaerae bacterium]
MRKKLLIVVTFVCVFVSGTVHAHGPQIQVTVDNNQITTRNLFLNEPYNTYPAPASSPVSVYVMPLAPINAFGGTEWFAQPNSGFQVTGPGIAWGYGWTYTDSTHYGTNNVPVGANFVETMNGGLQQWDGSAFVTAAHGAQLAGYRSSGTQAISGSATPSFTYSAIAAPTAPSPDPHGSAFWQLTGDGVIPNAGHPPAAVDDGIYVEEIQLSLINQPVGSDVQSSAPFHFVLFKGVDVSDAAAAAELAFPGASIQVVPEPAALGLLCITGCLLIGTRRRRRLLTSVSE